MPRRTDVRLRLLSVLLALVGLVCIAQQPQPARGQLGAPGCGATVGKLIYQPCASSAFTPSCTASTNWLARATNVTLTADKTNYDNLLCGLNTDGVLAKLDALYIFAAPDAVTAKLNLLSSSFPLTQTGTVTFSAYHGLTGDASTGFEDTGFNPFAAAGHFTQNSSSISAYVLSSRSTSQNWSEIGAETNNFSFILPQVGGTANYAVNSGSPPTPVNANAQGLWIASRTTSSVDTLYKNGASFNVGADASATIDNDNFYIFASNVSNAGTRKSGDQLSAAHIGGALTGTDVSSLSTRLNTFMTAYGINVF